MEQERMSAASVMLTMETINELINSLVSLQRIQNAPFHLEKLGLSIVDVNRIINLLSDYDKALEAALRNTNVQWPPKV